MADQNVLELAEGDVPGAFAQEGVKKDEAPHFGGGAEAEHPLGVQYQGPFESATDGSARAVRLHARALSDAGLPVLLQSFTNSFIGPDGVRIGAEAMDEDVKKETHDLRHRDVGALGVRIKHMVVSSAEMLRQTIVPGSVAMEQDIERAVALRSMLYRTTILYSVWERTTIDRGIAAIMQRIGECWVPCRQNQRLLREHGIERVHVIPHPFDVKSDMAKLTGRRASTDGEKRFYAIGLWQPRKHFHETIGGFLLAFRPGARATLTIKHKETHLPGYPTARESVEEWLKDPRVLDRGWRAENLEKHLWLPEKTWSDSQILKLHFDSNVYVCASRGEAFCLPAFDAKVAGNRMLLVGFGGAVDFSGPGDTLIPYELEPVPALYGWEPDARWAVTTVDSIAAAMRKVEAPAEFSRHPGLSSFTMEAVGKAMRGRVESVVREARA